MNTQIATATEQQSSVTEEINRNVTLIADYSRMTADDVTQCNELCQQLHQYSQTLNQLMGSFKLKS